MIEFIICLVIICFIILLGSAKWIKINKQTVYFKNLDAELNSFKILHLTDIHADSENRIQLNFWRKLDDLDFDIAVITGDIISYSADCLEPHLAEIKKLTDRVPVFFAEGNHDAARSESVRKILDKTAIVILDNEKINFSHNKKNIEIIGLMDYSRIDCDFRRILTELLSGGSDGFKLLLCHQPQIFDMISAEGNILMLAGHTHGGHIRLPFFPVIIAPGQGFFPKYGMGLYEKGDSKMYISTGLSAPLFPPRFYNRPEISLIEIKDISEKYD